MPSVPRLYFGRMVNANLKLSHCCKGRDDILGFGKTVKEEGPAGTQDEAISRQLQPTIAALDSHSLKLEEGPYQDKDGLVADLVSDVCRDMEGDGMTEVLERVIDRVRPFINPDIERALPRKYGRSKRDFHFNIDLTTYADTLPVAGNILADEERISPSPITGSKKFEFMHPMEPIIIAVSLLRYRKIKAYPAHAISEGHESGEELSPIIAVVDSGKEVPLHTCTLQGNHPDMGAVDFMSDNATMGIVHGMRAIMRAKHLAAELVVRFLEGRALSKEDTLNQARRIGDDLILCHRHVGEYNDFVRDGLQFLHYDIMHAESWINLRSALSGLPVYEKQPDPFLANKGINKPAPVVPIDPDHIGMFLAMDETFLYMYQGLGEVVAHAWAEAAERASEFAGAVQSYLKSRIEPEQGWGPVGPSIPTA